MPHLSLLGGAVLEDETGPVTGRAARPQPLALLALLATAPSQERSRGKLVGLLWPEASESQARNRLSTCVHRVRTGLDEDVILSVGDDLRLNQDVLTCDVSWFEQALEAEEPQRAVDLYDGPFLDGFRLPDSPAFEKWVDAERARWTRAYREALEALAEAAEEQGEAAVAADWWRERANEDPYDSRVVRRLMEALVAAGNRAEALRAAEAHDRLMRDELELSPDPAVHELVEELRSETESEGIVPAEREPADGEGSRESPPGGIGAPTSDTGQPYRKAPEGHRASSTAVRFAVALLLVAGVGAGGWLLMGGGEIEESPIDDRSVAVLPFAGSGGDRSDAISQGIYGGVHTSLANVSELRVTSPRSARRYADAETSVSEIARELGVRWIVDGDVRRADGTVRVYARLTDAREDETRLARRYERDLTTENVFAIESDLATAIVESLRAELTTEERERIDRRPTGDLEAYRLYSRGRQLLVQRTDSAMRRAEELFRRAVERDSTFAPAWAALAKSLVLYPEARNRDPDRVFPSGREAARRALELDPELPEAHMALAILHFYRLRLPSSLPRLNRAVEVEPSHAQAYHGLNLAHLVLGRPEEALTYARRAVALSPLSPENQRGLGLASVAVGDHEGALQAARREREIESEYLSGSTFMEGYARYRMGDLTALDTVVSDPVERHLMALAEATSGNEAPARELLTRYQRTLDGPAFVIGLLQAALGREAQALETFEAAFRSQETSGGGMTIRLRYMYPEVLGPLRRDSRWESLMRTVNVAWGLNPDGSLPSETTMGGTS